MTSCPIQFQNTLYSAFFFFLTPDEQTHDTLSNTSVACLSFRSCFPELRSQLNEQLRALDGRVDTQTALVGELQDWFRRRAELHQDYSFKLDKLAKSLQARHKEQKYK
ncbi:SLIT-ROBO Rho GTPase-activating protein 2B [Portunus trituberculatus]|uniref:SLIT-ROBO Rho GTPase-activating protein 2B n=1 Tax=Portunus trituberculatus TaxID=210409 RepID=A0A5B7K3S8_PORTR|nr:SLIT-ROBO Rho GTPase-activating protein 2B [Portunus trituberculatus]